MRIELVSKPWQGLIIIIILYPHWSTVKESNLSTWFCRPADKHSRQRCVGGNNLTWTSNYILMRYAFYQLKYVAMVCVVGLEPTTHGLKGRYSTNWVIHTLVDPQRIELHPSVLQTDVRTSYTKDPKYNIHKNKTSEFLFSEVCF